MHALQEFQKLLEANQDLPTPHLPFTPPERRGARMGGAIMKYSTYRTCLILAAGFVMLILAAGCATPSDLEQVRRGLSSDLDRAKSQAQTELRTVREKLDAAQANTRATFEAEHKVMVALQGRADEQEAKVRALSSQLVAAHDALTGEIADVRKVIQEAGARWEADLALFHRAEEQLTTLSAESQRLQSALFALTATLARHNRGEAEALKQRLRETEKLAKDLDTGSRTPPQNVGEPP